MECLNWNIVKMLNVQNVYKFYPTVCLTGKRFVVINESHLLSEYMLYWLLKYASRKDLIDVDAWELMASIELTVEVTDSKAISQLEKRDVVYWIEHLVLDCGGLCYNWDQCLMCCVCVTWAPVKIGPQPQPCLRVYMWLAVIKLVTHE